MTERFGKILELWRYPVSALRGERIDHASLDFNGVLHDRGWGMVDIDGKVAAPETERRWRFAPDMMARMGDGGPEICVDEDIWLPLTSDAANSAASLRAGFPVTFKPLAHRIETAAHRIETAAHRIETAASHEFAAPRYDRGHLHILTTASMQALAHLLPQESRVDVRRFRPNIVVELDNAETGFPDRQLIGQHLRIGNALIAIDGPCERCSFTALKQGDLPFAKEVMHAIARNSGGGFGVLGSIIEPATIHQGDEIRLS